FIVKAGIEKARMKIFETQINKYGGSVKTELNDYVTHIIVDDKMDVDKLCRLIKADTPPQDNLVVKSNWLSLCFRNKKLEDTAPYLLETFLSTKSEINCSDSDSGEDKNASKEKEADKQAYKVGTMFNSHSKPKWNFSGTTDILMKIGIVKINVISASKWTCARSSKNPKPNVNQAITEKLEEMIRNYESTNDKWRAFGYQKAVQAIRSHPNPISSWEEARNLRGVGAKLADKIWEIVQSGELRKLNEFKSSEEIKVLNIFNNVWGAGPTTARAWYQQGFRTLEDLKTKAKLTSQQKVGVRLYDDILDRMSREEAGEIEEVVREAAESLQDGIIAQACGSYRRGKATCGDVDVLITHPDGKSHRGIFSKLINLLTEQGFLTDHLVSVEDSGNQKKYLGVCKLKGDNRKHRRLDIIVVPYNEYGCALVYFTGSAHFNRSLRHLAKKMNMSLNEHALKYGVVRKGGEKIHEGTLIPTPTEKSVFEQFKIPYRPPEERD
ncbi:hypothetical protein LOTGIDRAFT_72491, partial [Lottia gigantea]